MFYNNQYIGKIGILQLFAKMEDPKSLPCEIGLKELCIFLISKWIASVISGNKHETEQGTGQIESRLCLSATFHIKGWTY